MGVGDGMTILCPAKTGRYQGQQEIYVMDASLDSSSDDENEVNSTEKKKRMLLLDTGANIFYSGSEEGILNLHHSPTTVKGVNGTQTHEMKGYSLLLSPTGA
jgi:hypothetical protein